MKGFFICYIQEFGFDFRGNVELLECFNLGNGFYFKSLQWGCSVEMGQKGLSLEVEDELGDRVNLRSDEGLN